MKIFGFALIALLVFFAASYSLYFPLKKQCCSSVYSTFDSPDNAYQIRVYSVPIIPFMLPGNAGDSAGYVQLVASSGGVINEQRVDMVQLIDQVEWQADEVHIKLFANWRLPH